MATSSTATFPTRYTYVAILPREQGNSKANEGVMASDGMGQSAVMTLELENDGTLEIKLFGPDEIHACMGIYPVEDIIVFKT
eukprot:170545-Amorphochlora_amoeboformis.AAC.1